MPNDKLPPHDIDAEEAVIGSLLIDGTAIYKVNDTIVQEDFYSEQTREVYGACLLLYERDEAINQITVSQELARQEKLEMCGGAAYLSHVISICPTSLDIEYYGNIVYRLSMMRKLIAASHQIEAIGYDAGPDVDDSIDHAEDILYNLRHGKQQRDFVKISQLLDRYYEIAAGSELEAVGDANPHVITGYTGLDNFLNGLKPSDLVILAGRPSMGKTSLALSMARNAAVLQKAVVAIFSLEMSCESLVLRLLSSESEIDARRLSLGLLGEDEEMRVMDAIGVLSEAPIYIDDSPRLKLAEMRSKLRRLEQERGVNLVIVDHLGLVNGEMKDRVQEISLISRTLKALARELRVPVVALSQLSRASEHRDQHKPRLSDLRDSGSIEQDADVVLFIYRDEYYYTEDDWEKDHRGEEYPRGQADVIIAKHRNGQTGQIKLRFRNNLAKFENMPMAQASEL